MIKNLEQYPIVREPHLTSEDLLKFEDLIVSHWEGGKIRGPVHLSNGNENQLIEISKRINPTDWVFSTWRSHYHALIKGLQPEWVENQILQGSQLLFVIKKIGSTLRQLLGEHYRLLLG